jgi:protein SDA1
MEVETETIDIQDAAIINETEMGLLKPASWK